MTRLGITRTLAMVVVFAAVLVAFVVAVGLLTPIQSATLWTEATKAAMTALGIAVIGGFVKLLFDEHVREREERAQRDKFVESLIVDLDNLRATVQRAQLLLRAHHSAGSYREQMNELIGVRVRCTSLERTVLARWASEKNREVTAARCAVTDHLGQLKRYLDAVLDEYAKNYRTVRELQFLDERVTPDTFPELYDFLAEDEGSRYERDVVPGCKESTESLFQVLRTSL